MSISDREIEAAAMALREFVQLRSNPSYEDGAQAILSAAATARPDWEAIARELYEDVMVLAEIDAINHGTTVDDEKPGSVRAYERALGEGSGAESQ